MPLALLLAMDALFLSLPISPDPANPTIVASGANRGFRRTLPLVTGATLDFVLLLVFVGLWFVRTIEAYPRFFDYLGMAGATFIAHVDYRTATADPRLAFEENGVPEFLQGVLLQWPNPKAWIACVSGMALPASPSMHTPLLAFMATYLVVCYLSLVTRASLGDRVALLLDSPQWARLFSRAMGGTLVLTAGYMFHLRPVVSLGRRRRRGD